MRATEKTTQIGKRLSRLRRPAASEPVTPASADTGQDLAEMLDRALEEPLPLPETKLPDGTYDTFALKEREAVKVQHQQLDDAKNAFVKALIKHPDPDQTEAGQRFCAVLAEQDGSLLIDALGWTAPLPKAVELLGLDRTALSHRVARSGGKLHVLAQATRLRDENERWRASLSAERGYVFARGGKPEFRERRPDGLPANVLLSDRETTLPKSTELLCGRLHWFNGPLQRVPYGEWMRSARHCAVCESRAQGVEECNRTPAALDVQEEDYRQELAAMLRERLAARTHRSRHASWSAWSNLTYRLRERAACGAIGRAVSTCGDDALLGPLGAHQLAVLRSRLADESYRLVDLLSEKDWDELGQIIRVQSHSYGVDYSLHDKYRHASVQAVLVGRLRVAVGLHADCGSDAYSLVSGVEHIPRFEHGHLGNATHAVFPLCDD